MARLPPPHSDPAVMSAEEPLSLWPGCASACVCVCVSTSCSHSWYTHGRPGRFLLPAATHLSTCQVSDWMSLWELVRSFFFFFCDFYWTSNCFLFIIHDCDALQRGRPAVLKSAARSALWSHVYSTQAAVSSWPHWHRAGLKDNPEPEGEQSSRLTQPRQFNLQELLKEHKRNYKYQI